MQYIESYVMSLTFCRIVLLLNILFTSCANLILDNVQGWHGTKMVTPWQLYRIKMVINFFIFVTSLIFITFIKFRCTKEKAKVPLHLLDILYFVFF